MLKYIGFYKFSLLIMFLLSHTHSKAIEIIETKDACGYFDSSFPEKVIHFSSNEETEDIIKNIVGIMGLTPNFKLKAAAVPNAAAVIYENERYILYNQYFILDINRKTNNKWAARSILAHEVAHHLNDHTLFGGNSKDRWKEEIDADRFSGFVLQKLGASIDDARAVMVEFGNPLGSFTHPPKHDRLAAIDNGWFTACDSDPGCNNYIAPAQSNTNSNEGWSYVGHFSPYGGIWKTRYFNFSESVDPSKLIGENLVVKRNLNIRKGIPTPSGEFRPAVGSLLSGEQVKIVEIKEWSNSGYMWAKINY